MKPSIKPGDILIYTDVWYQATNTKIPENPIKFVATGKVKEINGEYLIYVIKENTSHVQIYNYTFLQKKVNNEQSTQV